VYCVIVNGCDFELLFVYVCYLVILNIYISHEISLERDRNEQQIYHAYITSKIMYKEIFPRNPRDRNSLHLCNFPWILAFRPHHSKDMLPDDVRSRNQQLGQVAVVKSGLKIFALSLFYRSFGPIMYNERFICEWKIELCSLKKN
jgi:hypothetical protein